MKIYNIGSLNIDYVYRVDHFVRPGETLSADSLTRFPGGKGLNQSVALAKAGAAVIHGGMVGTEGDFLIETLKRHGVDVSRIRTVETPTGHAVIQVDRTGQNSIVLFGGANQKTDAEYARFVLSDAKKGDILLLQNEISHLKEIIEIAHKKELFIAFNPAPFSADLFRLPLEWIDLWICNEIEGGELTGQSEPEAMMRQFSVRYPGCSVLLTLGASGALLQYHGQEYRQDIFPCKAVDTTAAGDTFTGFFLATLMSGGSAADALKTAAAASSVAVSRNGASDSIPTYQEVAQRIAEGEKA